MTEQPTREDGLMEKEHIYLVVPTVTGTIGKGADWLMCAATRMSLHPASPYRFTTHVLENAKPPEYMWNVAADRMLKSGASRLWKVDNDIVPAPNAFALLDTPGDIVGGMVFSYHLDIQAMENTRVSLCAYKHDFRGVLRPIAPPPEAPAIQRVHAVGGQSMVVRRAVLEDINMRLSGKCDPPALFQRHYEANGRMIKSADLDFCERANKLGYEINVNLGVPFNQQVTLGLNDVMYMTNGGAMKDEDPTPKIVLAS